MLPGLCCVRLLHPWLGTRAGQGFARTGERVLLRVIVSALAEIVDYFAALHEKSSGTPEWAEGALFSAAMTGWSVRAGDGFC